MKKNLARIFSASLLAIGMGTTAMAGDSLEINLQAQDGSTIPCPEVNDYLKKFTRAEAEGLLQKRDPTLTEELNRFATYCTARFDDANEPPPDFHSAGKNAPPVADDLMGVEKKAEKQHRPGARP